MSDRRLPDVFYNGISVLGAVLALASFSIILLFILIDLFVRTASLYLGILTYMILPGFLVAGIGMIFGGALWERRRRAQGLKPSALPVLSLNLSDPRQLRLTLLLLGGVALFVVGTSLGTYKAYHISESVKFCGTLCHTVMEPEYTAYQRSAHARVRCVACHIGPGADWFVKSKVTGAYQIYSVIFKKYHRPIETPIRNLRPARETCEQCHWPEKFFGERTHANPHFLADEKNTPYPITLSVKIGGGGGLHGPGHGIHWHMALQNKIEYIAKDRARQEIVWVRSTSREGQVTEYALPDLTDKDRRAMEVRTLDCIDCHNRPSHNYRPPTIEVNQAMAQGTISPTLPYVKRESVRALDADYADKAAAFAQIDAKLTGFYRENYPDLLRTRGADIKQAIAGVQDIYAHNFFPLMKVTWRSYPENIGHTLSPGCFRCHGSEMTSSDGKTITKDCTSCHALLAQGQKPGPGEISTRGLAFEHPVDIGGMEQSGQCSACHQGGAELY